MITSGNEKGVEFRNVGHMFCDLWRISDENGVRCNCSKRTIQSGTVQYHREEMNTTMVA